MLMLEVLKKSAELGDMAVVSFKCETDSDYDLLLKNGRLYWNNRERELQSFEILALIEFEKTFNENPF